MQLHYETLVANGAQPRHTLMLLHGILGRGGNLRTLAQRFVAQRETWQAVLIDLRAHGESLGGERQADSMATAIADVAQLSRSLELPTTAVVGHSFGGKVALGLPATQLGIRHIVALDSAPGIVHHGKATVTVLKILDSLRGPWATREDFIRSIQAYRQPRFLGQWLATNLEAKEGGFVFRLSLPRIRSLLEGYFTTNLWPSIEAEVNQPSGPCFHFVIASKSPALDQPTRAHAVQLAKKAEARVTVDFLDSNHWVHVEDPNGTLSVILSRVK